MTLTGAQLVASLERRFVTVNDDVRAGKRNINVFRPRSADDLISEQDFERDERLPYWAELWPSSTILANFIVDHALPPLRGIELGCGVGLVSIAATLAGHTMLATDYYDDALHFTRANAYRNLRHEIDTRLVDWRDMPDDLRAFDLILASDVLYESSYARIVSGAIDHLLSDTGRAFLADPGRVATGAFLDACSERALRVTKKTDRPYLAGQIRQTITVYEITR
jgi:predicted nicotinamide N-methyase